MTWELSSVSRSSWPERPTMSFEREGTPMVRDGEEQEMHVEVEREVFWDWPLQANDGVVMVHNDQDKFEVHLDAQYFTPKEIQVRVIGRLIDIKAEHEKRPGDLGDVSRSFARSYKMPDDVNEALVKSSLSPRGILIISAAKKTQIFYPPRSIMHDSAWATHVHHAVH
ncbi:hypothetical protein PRIPAC_89230 [Pristionchus pacificus]|uniref:SHSP domain-containing protein n=1 Tax=Pristionchus pacificus TaxID=54126 RepID=A0A2A6B890_PRIPA|nr:hypothetical protein PRIPAC_89230 [Pristionchus pacificus]|eukprot:PDM62085.1 hypothetical protein PRIPAC_51527 [Pristionchus pacificus]